ncbi:MAG: adenylate/guanylate cyclase domain-containing protein [Deltaproteobacteria bacterium]|nr:adenylate/guanylate cyclase domain-containing protein [Deltaproteobacteria bacterium]
MKRLRSFLFKLSGFRISLFIALTFLIAHFALESDAFHSGFFSKSGFLYRLEYAALDTKFQARKIPFKPAVVVAAADEKSIEKYGLWPWNRKRISELIDRLTEYGAKVIAFDIVFADEDKNSAFRELTRFKDIYDESGLYRKVQPALLGSINDKLATALDASLTIGGELKPPQKKKVSIVEQNLRDAMTSIGAYQDKSQRFYDIMTDSVKSVSPDEALARSIRSSKRVVTGYFAFTNPSELSGLSLARLNQNFERIKRAGTNEIYEHFNGAVGTLAPPPWDAAQLAVPRAVGVQAPLPLIAEASEYFGLFNILPDPDKTIRHVPMFFLMNELLLPSLSLQAVAVYHGGGFFPYASPTEVNRLAGVFLHDAEKREDKMPTLIPTNERGLMLINYYSDPIKSIPTVSIADIIDKQIDPAAVKDKLVLVGVTAIGTFDLRANPYSISPGVYIQAAAMQNMIDRNFMERWSGTAFFEGLALLLFGILAGLFIPKVRPSFGFAFVVLFIAGIIVLDQMVIFPSGNWIRIVAPILELITVFVAVTVYRFLTEEREKRVIRNAFQFYLSKSVVDSVLQDTSKLKLGGEKKDLTVLFSDIRGFTTISERLSPEDLVHFMNEYLTPMTDLVFSHEGTLDKYMGDAVMAFWGAPVDQPDHATKACKTALAMMDKLHELQDGWRARGLPEIDIGIGMNSGVIVVGNMGSTARFDYTVMGDSVNLGSRLEGINKEYGTNIIISEFTYERAKADVYVRLLDSVRVKGKHEPVRIFELRGLGRPQGLEEQFIITFEKGIALYKAQKWDEAIKTFNHCLEMNQTDYCSKKYIDRCESMKEDPPGDGWDGVYTMKTK